MYRTDPRQLTPEQLDSTELLNSLKDSQMVLMQAIGALRRHGLAIPKMWDDVQKDAILVINKAESR